MYVYLHSTTSADFAYNTVWKYLAAKGHNKYLTYCMLYFDFLSVFNFVAFCSTFSNKLDQTRI